MKKLFNTGSLITINEFSSIQINGPCALVTLGPDFAKVKSGDYIIEAAGDELVIDLLSEEVALLSFDSIHSITITKLDSEENRYDL
ncbi:hypothetical protein [Sporosarcina jiandibaonis]|uniref:hypothetical protein n=1 Tax=Sporosarcina jiandibaonis TaxID=2715535 RepID=UPI001551E5C5|nr:hypothetical protein [Sporosarcina jiandibaonis]